MIGKYVVSFVVSYQNGPDTMAHNQKCVIIDPGVTVKEMMDNILALHPDSDIVIQEIKSYVSKTT